MITYGTARPDELDEVATFWRRTTDWHPSWPVPTHAEVASRFSPDAGAAVVVLARRADGPIVGVALLRPIDHGRAAGPGALFGSTLLVHPHHRSGPVAGGLMDAVFARAVSVGSSTLILLVDPVNTVAYRLYRYYGFRYVRPDVTENCFVELESHWPLVARFLVQSLAADLPRWPDPSLRRLARGFRPRGRPADGPDSVPNAGERFLRYAAEVPAWHNPAVEVVVDRLAQLVVGLRGQLVETEVRTVDGRQVASVRNTSPEPLRLTIGHAGAVAVTAVVAPGDELVGGRLDLATDWTVELRRGDDRLAAFTLAVPAPAPVPDPPVGVAAPHLQVEVSADDGTAHVRGPDGGVLVDALWPELGPPVVLSPRRPLATGLSTRRLDDGAVETSGPADRCVRELERAGRRSSDVDMLAGIAVHRVVRPTASGVELLVDVEIPPGRTLDDATLCSAWWWRADDAVMAHHTEAGWHRWAFTAHALPGSVARAVLPSLAQPPRTASCQDGAVDVRCHGIDLRLAWTATDAAAAWEQRLQPDLRIPLAGLGPGRHTVLRTELRATPTALVGSAITPPRRSPACVSDPASGLELELDVDDAGGISVALDGRRWVEAECPPEPLRSCLRAPSGIVAVIARGGWRWSADGGVHPESWSVVDVDAERCGGRLQTARVVVEAADGDAGLGRVALQFRRATHGWELNARALDASPEGLALGFGMVVRPRGTGVVTVETALGTVCLPTTVSDGHLRLSGRTAATVRAAAGGLELRGGHAASVTAWPVDGADGAVRCPVLLTERGTDAVSATLCSLAP